LGGGVGGTSFSAAYSFLRNTPSRSTAYSGLPKDFFSRPVFHTLTLVWSLRSGGELALANSIAEIFRKNSTTATEGNVVATLWISRIAHPDERSFKII
jgi:hypothetical protein